MYLCGSCALIYQNINDDDEAWSQLNKLLAILLPHNAIEKKFISISKHLICNLLYRHWIFTTINLIWTDKICCPTYTLHSWNTLYIAACSSLPYNVGRKSPAAKHRVKMQFGEIIFGRLFSYPSHKRPSHLKRQKFAAHLISWNSLWSTYYAVANYILTSPESESASFTVRKCYKIMRGDRREHDLPFNWPQLARVNRC